MKTKKKKRFLPKIEVFFSRNQVKTNKKKVFTAVWDYIWPELNYCKIYSCWLAIFGLISSEQISMGGRLNLDGGTLNLDEGTLTLDEGTRPPYNLSTDCTGIRDNSSP